MCAFVKLCDIFSVFEEPPEKVEFREKRTATTVLMIIGATVSADESFPAKRLQIMRLKKLSE